ncbi:hypothetical protein [Marinovum sp.]|uniref:hypothetical protein n=1 Tax=Marinovum sp. TaxID=2024839 RepID=UPI003A93F348
MLLPPAARAAGTGAAACPRIEEAALAVGLSPAFLARALLDRGEITSPEAIPTTAGILAALQQRYGSPGLAALVLAGGETQAEGFLTGGGVPPATVDFVIVTTGETPEFWRDNPQEVPEFRLASDADFLTACVELIDGRWGEPLPELQPMPEPAPITLALVDPAQRSLRPKVRPKPKLAKWGAQLAFGDSRDKARVNFTRATRSCRKVVGDSPDIIFVENRVRGRPGYWMARVSRMQREAASDLCRDARRAGCTCVVYKNY